MAHIPPPERRGQTGARRGGLRRGVALSPCGGRLAIAQDEAKRHPGIASFNAESVGAAEDVATGFQSSRAGTLASDPRTGSWAIIQAPLRDSGLLMWPVGHVRRTWLGHGVSRGGSQNPSPEGAILSMHPTVCLRIVPGRLLPELSAAQALLRIRAEASFLLSRASPE